MRKLVFICIYLSLTIPCAAATIYVKEGSTGTGSSWADAYGSLQDALDDAVYDDQIWVTEGTYKPSYDYGLGTGSRRRHFRMINGVAIYGGFQTGGSDFANRDPDQYETVLSGDLLGNDNPNTPVEDLLHDPSRADNCFHVFYHPDGLALDPNAVLDGFTVTLGNANGPSEHYYGGGMYNHASNPIIINCTLRSNSAGEGGGMFNDYDSSPTVIGCTFNSNNGCGMYNFDSSPVVTNCTFNSNSSDFSGGGMRSLFSSPTVTGCIFIGNSAIRGGGMFDSGSNSTVANCTFTDNSATIGGGGGIYSLSNLLTVINCTFTDNSAIGGGGGIYSLSNLLTVINCILWGNTASSGGNEIVATASVSYCCVQGGYTGTGNIDADPLFADPNNGDYHLKSQGWRWDNDANDWTWDDVTSPCIDAGNPGALLGNEPITLDVDPLNRWGQNLRINMGACGGTAEASMPPDDWALLADLTNDGIVNLEDFANQAINWQHTQNAQPGDLNRNGTIDLNDAILMANDWLKTTTWH